MKSAKNNAVRKNSLDGRTMCIYITFFLFTMTWVLAVVKVFMIEHSQAVRHSPVQMVDTAKSPLVSIIDVVNSPAGTAKKQSDGPAKIVLKRPTAAATSKKEPKVVDLHLPKQGLSWPPVLANGSIPAGDGSDIMPITDIKVPKFWSPPTDVPLESVGSKVNGVETIFLMIASYRDFQCRETIASAFNNADHPEALFVGAADQVTEGDIGCALLDVPCAENPDQVQCKYGDQISVFTMDAALATGPVTARHIGDRLYRGQYFVMQMDAHCTFVKHWDTKLIAQWRETQNEMAVLTSYLSDVQGSVDQDGNSRRNTRPIMCNSAFEGAPPARYLRHGSQPEDYAVIRDMPQLEPFWAAGFSFSRGHFKIRVPYDGRQPMVFQVPTSPSRISHYL
jgi:hypothetical protein